MARKLNSPNIDNILIIDFIISHKNGYNKQYLMGMKKKWKKRTQKYLKYNGNPEKINEITLTTNGKKIFNSLYEDDKNVKIKIKDKIKPPLLNKCPFCGLDETPSTLDHYLPREKYPEFSVTPKNLIPMCFNCNSIYKKTTTLKDGKRVFINPYYDQLDQEIFQLDFIKPFGSNYQIYIKSTIPEPLKSVCMRTLNHLNIDKRFLADFHCLFAGFQDSLIDMKYSKKQIKDFLQHSYKANLINGKNYLGTVFYKAALNNNELIKYFKEMSHNS